MKDPRRGNVHQIQAAGTPCGAVTIRKFDGLRVEGGGGNRKDGKIALGEIIREELFFQQRRGEVDFTAEDGKLERIVEF